MNTRKSLRIVGLVAVAIVAGLWVSLYLTSPREWQRAYAGAWWYRNHPEFEYAGLLRRNTRDSLFVKDDGSWEIIARDGPPVEGSGRFYSISKHNCNYLLDRAEQGREELYVFTPREMSRKTFIGIEEIASYRDVLADYVGKYVIITGWERDQTITNPVLAGISVRVLVPGRIKEAALVGGT